MCCDPKTWGNVNEPVEVLGVEPESDPEVRSYRIRYADGTEATAFVDELEPDPTDFFVK